MDYTKYVGLGLFFIGVILIINASLHTSTNATKNSKTAMSSNALALRFGLGITFVVFGAFILYYPFMNALKAEATKRPLPLSDFWFEQSTQKNLKDQLNAANGVDPTSFNYFFPT